MKPIRLMMRAFGPYKDEQVIDFRDLKEHRLFAISGKTGAGKTTIFDGIAFALYGNGSGVDREDTKGLRSQFADEKVHTAVELTFQSKGQTYRIFRQLAHKKAGNKSETGEKIALFEIGLNDEEVPACKPKLTDVRLKIEEIIGLSYDQFNQIVMLPQGEFRKLLTSDTKNKEKILRKVFKTERYDKIAQKLEDKKRLAEEEAKLARKMRDQAIEQIAGAIPPRESLLFTRLAEHSNIFQILEALAEEHIFYEQQSIERQSVYNATQQAHKQKYEESVAARQQNEQLEQLATKRRQLAQLEQQRPAIELVQQEYEQAVRAAKIVPAFETVSMTQRELNTVLTQQQQTTAEYEQATEQLQQASAQYDEQKQQEPARVQLANEMNELEKLKPLYEEIEQLEKALPLAQAAVEQAEVAENQLIVNAATLKAEQAKLMETVEQLEERVATLPEQLQQLQSLKETTQIFKQLHDREQAMVTSLQKFEQAQQLAIVKKQLHDEEQQKWISHRAYELASELVPGEACPVCGSLEHPNVQQHAELADKKQFEQAQQALEQARQQQAMAKAQYETIGQQVTQLIEQLQVQDIMPQQQEHFEQRYAQTEQVVKALTNDSAKLKQHKQTLKQLQQQAEQVANELQQVRTDKETTTQHYVQQQTLLTSKQQVLPETAQNLTEVQALLTQKATSYAQLKQQFEQAERQYNACNVQVAKLQQTRIHLAEQQEQLTAKLEAGQQAYRALLEQYHFTTEQQFLQARRQDAVMAQLQQQVQQFEQQIQTYKQVIGEQEVLLAGKQMMDLQLLQLQVQQLQDMVDQALVQLNAVQGYARSCLEYKEKLEQVAAEIDRLERYSGEIVQLYKVLVGQNDEFISFERFIQIGYLEQITEAANARLLNLSNGQFILSCSDRKEGNRRQSGLSLDVYDSYTGLPRDVKSLSGGEKFNASLCLALGLADVIQSFQGNVRIDTMFIDEGFGSLDEESLVRAIDILIELQKSGRIVGVISHVEELKAAMPAIIQIEKLKSGHSRAEIIVK